MPGTRAVLALLAFAVLCHSKDRVATIAPESSVYIEPGNDDVIIREAFSARRVPLRFTPLKSDADYVMNTALIQTSVDVQNENRVATFPVTYGSVWLETREGVVVWKHIVSNKIVKRGNRAMAADAAIHIYEAIAKPNKR